MPGTSICVTSGKGGTGKTSFVAGVSAALAVYGQKVLALDMDMGLRNLDISLGLSDKTVFDISDVISGRVDLNKAVTPHHIIPGLCFLAAPLGTDFEEPDIFGVRNLLEEIEKKFDFCLIDSPPGVGYGFDVIASSVQSSIIIVTPDLSSLRDAQVANLALMERGVTNVRLVVNRVEENMMARGFAPGIDYAIDHTGAQLLGIVPEDREVAVAANGGWLVHRNRKSAAAKHYCDIARRILGERVAL